MAEETQKTAHEAPLSGEQVVVITDVPQPEIPSGEKQTPPPPPPTETQEPMKPTPVSEEKEDDEPPLQAEISKPAHGEKIVESVSFKEETTVVSDLPDVEKKALNELKQLVQQALKNREFIILPPKEEEKPIAASEVVETKPESEIIADTKNDTQKESSEAEEVVVEKTEAIPVVEDEDGAKTVEAIKETIVAVSSVPPEETVNTQPPTEESKVSGEESETPSHPPAEEVSIWGVPLLHDERSDVILLKFLRARDFKVKDAFAMLKSTVRWRKEFGIDELLEQDLGNDLEKAVFMQGVDKEGHPVCYNVYGEFQNKELYAKLFSDEEKRQNFLRWRIQFLEKSIRKLDFSQGGISTIVQVNDLKNSPGPGKWELRQATKQALHLLQDNYPEFVAKQVFINVPWWYLAVNRMISPFLTQRTKSKFVFAGPSKSAETLFKYIAAEQVPVQYGGLGKDGEFSTADAVTEITVKPATKQSVEFPVDELCLLSWEVRVVGWDVSYGAEFVPNAKESYTVIIQKPRKVVASLDEPVVHGSFKLGEPGKVVLTIDNSTSKKKKLLYRLKTKATSE